MITPRYYEDSIREIITEVPKDQQPDRIVKLMMDTLDCMGYSYGNSLIKESEVFDRKDG